MVETLFPVEGEDWPPTTATSASTARPLERHVGFFATPDDHFLPIESDTVVVVRIVEAAFRMRRHRWQARFFAAAVPSFSNHHSTPVRCAGPPKRMTAVYLWGPLRHHQLHDFFASVVVETATQFHDWLPHRLLLFLLKSLK